MNINRRKALGFLAAVPVAGPRLAQSVAAEQIAGVSLGMGAEFAALGVGQTMPSPERKGIKAALKLFGGIPDWLRGEWRRDARSAARIVDPDIAVLRSTSLAHKCMAQRERYVHMREREMMADTVFEEARARWYKTLWGQ